MGRGLGMPDVEQQLRDKLFSIHLGEATDSNKDAHFIAEALASKEMSPGLNIVPMTVVTVVNYIKMRPPKIKDLFWTLQRHGRSAFIVAILLRSKMVITREIFATCL
ncbi:hypothetical protein TNCV_2578671 [Trichonephila clavipes]|nr:hypothetical protein TNCV_2578671 [Trichonephila clavipes]